MCILITFFDKIQTVNNIAFLNKLLKYKQNINIPEGIFNFFKYVLSVLYCFSNTGLSKSFDDGYSFLKIFLPVFHISNNIEKKN